MNFEHTLVFETPEQAQNAKNHLNGLVLTSTKTVLGSDPSFPTLTICTPYALGPVTRNAVRRVTQSVCAWWNCNPATHAPVPFLHRVTPGQVLFIVITFAMTLGIPPFMLDSTTLVTCLCMTALIAFFSSDVIGLVRSGFASPNERKGR